MQQFSHSSSVQETQAARQAHLSRLSYAIAEGDLEQFRDIITYEPEWMLNEADYSGSVPLHVAAVGPSSEILRLLLQKGASVHMRNKAGRTPLFLAANAGLEDRVNLLRMSGAHLHPEENGVAKVLCEKGSPQAVKCWELAGMKI